MDWRGKRTHDYNVEVVITITAPEKATQQHYEWLRLLAYVTIRPGVVAEVGAGSN